MTPAPLLSTQQPRGYPFTPTFVVDPFRGLSQGRRAMFTGQFFPRRRPPSFRVAPNPALAAIRRMLSRGPPSRILFVGAHKEAPPPPVPDLKRCTTTSRPTQPGRISNSLHRFWTPASLSRHQTGAPLLDRKRDSLFRPVQRNIPGRFTQKSTRARTTLS